ncbi:hypothetical protein DL770_003651 [Monosporascus sp. CRB-9-2]|nr:hypothetical protein DL770_003651 [Monosporascus sp. CRB-9-2]
MGSDHHEINAREAASVDSPADMLVIDFAALHSSPQERKIELDKLDKGFQTYGFVYLQGHSIPQQLVDEAFNWAGRFFALPLEVKLKIKNEGDGRPENDRGFSAEGGGYGIQANLDFPERNEFLEYGNPFHESGAPPNLWVPEAEIPGFRAFQELWWAECAKLQQTLLRAMGEALQLEDPEILCRQTDRNDLNVCLNYYPQTSVAPLRSHKQRRLHAHTDCGSLTLLFQDGVGGLEVHTGEVFKPVVPKKGTIILNVGDMLERQTNGRWKSAWHQVTAPYKTMMQKRSQVDGDVPQRYSIGCFGRCNPEVIINTLPGCEQRGKWSVSNDGEVLTCYDWMCKRAEEDRIATQMQPVP